MLTKDSQCLMRDIGDGKLVFFRHIRLDGAIRILQHLVRERELDVGLVANSNRRNSIILMRIHAEQKIHIQFNWTTINASKYFPA